MISVKRLPGPDLEDTLPIPIDPGLQAGFLDGLGEEVGRAAQELADAPLQGPQPKQVHGPRRIDHRGEVHITRDPGSLVTKLYFEPDAVSLYHIGQQRRDVAPP
jgi:hypothetical protein